MVFIEGDGGSPDEEDDDDDGPCCDVDACAEEVPLDVEAITTLADDGGGPGPELEPTAEPGGGLDDAEAVFALVPPVEKPSIRGEVGGGTFSTGGEEVWCIPDDDGLVAWFNACA